MIVPPRIMTRAAFEAYDACRHTNISQQELINISSRLSRIWRKLGTLFQARQNAGETQKAQDVWRNMMQVDELVSYIEEKL